MPVLGSASTITEAGGLFQRGKFIPAGSLDVWRAARALHATDRPEVVFLGDSTFWGQADTTVNDYSPVTSVRSSSIAAGYTDGGLGVIGLTDAAAQRGAGLAPVSITTGAPGGVQGTVLLGSQSVVLDIGEAITYQSAAADGHIFRLWHNGVAGAATYSLNGAAAVAITHTDGTFTSVVLTGVQGQTNTLTVTNTAGTSYIDCEFLKATGIVYHRHAVPGAQVNTFMAADEATTNRQLEAILGLSQAGAIATQAAEGTHPAARKVRLAVLTLGINDINGIASQIAPRNADTFAAGASLFVNAARSAGADPVLYIPHWKVNQSGNVYGKAGAVASAALAAVAVAQGCVLIDGNEFLGGPVARWSGTYYNPNGVHLKAPGYQRIGEQLFTELVNA